MGWKRGKEIISTVIVRMQKPYYQGVAAELAFFYLMSMVPLFILLGEFLGVFSLSIGLFEDILSQYVSADLIKSIGDYLEHTPSGTINVIFVVIALWSASKAQFSMIRIANYTYTGMHSGRGFFRERLRAMGSVILSIVVIAFSLVILVYGEPLIRIIGLYVENISGIPFSFNQIWYALRWPLGIAVYFFVIGFLYYILPTKKLPYKKVIPGSVLASAGMLLVTWIYSFYTSRFANYDILYGGLGSVIGLLIWFYILGYVIVIGIVFNSAVLETKS